MRNLVIGVVGIACVGICRAQAAESVFTVEMHLGKAKLATPTAFRLHEEAKAAVESARVAIEKLWRKPTTKQTLHVWADPKEYEAAAKDPLWSFQRPAMARPERKEAHVLLTPMLDEVALATVGLPPNVRFALIEQTAMLAAFDKSAIAKADSWCAEVFAAGVLEAVAFAQVPDGVDPNRDTRWYVLQEWEGTGKLHLRESLAARGLPKSASDWDGRCQMQAGTAHFLAKTGSGWARKLLSAPTKSEDRLLHQRIDAVEAVVGKDWKKVEDNFCKLWRASPARWRVISPMVLVKDGRLVLASDADSWSTMTAVADPPKKAYAISGTVEIPEGSTAFATVMLNWHEGSYISCGFGKGRVRFEFVGGQQTDQRSLSAPIEIGKPCKFRIELVDNLVVSIDGAKVGEYPVASLWRKPWGLATFGGCVIFSDVKCEEMK